MALCLTVKQKKVLSYYQSYFAENGTFPNTSQAARHFGVKPDNVLKTVGAVFLKGGFTDGKPMTTNLLSAHGIAKPSKITITKGGRSYTEESLQKLRDSGKRTQEILRARRATAAKAKSKTPAASANIDAIIRREIVKYFRNMASGVAPTLNE